MVVSRTLQLCSCFFWLLPCPWCTQVVSSYGINVAAWDENLEVARMADEPK